MSEEIQVLLVEDNDDDAYLIEEILPATFQLHRIADGEAAYHYMLTHEPPPDVVLLDYRLPGMSGLEILQALKKQGRELGCIVLTVDMKIETAIAVMKAGTLDFWPKAKGYDQLPEIIRKVYRIMTERREKTRIEAALQASEQRYKRLVEGSPDVVYSYSNTRGGLYYSPQIESILGYSQAYLSEHPFLWQASIHSEDRHKRDRAFEDLQHEHDFDIEYRIKDKQGRWHWIRDRSFNRQMTEHELIVDGLATDITMHKRITSALRESEKRYRALADENARLLKQARKDAATKNSLLHEVNHRVQNNLTSILSLLHFEQQHTEENQATYQTILQELSGRIQTMALVHTMLSSSGWEPLPLDELTRRTIQAASQNQPQGKHLSYEVQPSTLRVSVEQANSLALILNELTTNTIKYAQHGREKAHIHIRFTYTSHILTLDFRDDGPGFPEDITAATRGHIGLQLLQGLVEHSLNGSVEFRNQRGAVTVIRFEIRDDEEPT